MIDNILELLKIAKGETENIKFAQGGNKMPETLKEGFKQIKKQMQWQKRK